MLNRHSRWTLFLSAMLLLAPVSVSADLVATFDDPHLTLGGADSYYNGSDGAGGFTSGGIEFKNSYDPTYVSWTGWAYSNTTDTTTAGYTNQYSAYTGGAKSGDQYGVYFEPFPLTSTVSRADNATAVFQGAFFTNTTFAALSMLDGDEFSKKFGGDTGSDADWFLLTVTGIGADGQDTGSVDFYLADYRFEDNGLDYVVDDWRWVDLTGLGEVASLKFDLSSSDVGSYGMNTPAYFAMDDLTAAVPEPSTLLLAAIGALAWLGGAVLRRRRNEG